MTWEKDDTKFGTDDFKKPEEGALPTLDDNTVLGSPETQTKSKTNVGKLAVLGIFLAGFIFIVVGLLIYQKNKKSGAYGGATATEKARPGFAEKNAEVQSDSIDSTKAELKKKQEEEEARLRAIEEEQKRLAEEERLRLEEERLKNAAAAPVVSSSQPVASGMTPEDRRMMGSVLLDTTGSRLSSSSGGSAESSDADQEREVEARLAAMGVQQGANPNAGFFGADESYNKELRARLQPTTLQARGASKLPNLNYLLKKGTIIPCALKTGIDTTQPGFVTCMVQNDVYSANGKTLLIERGATVFGEQQSSLKQGQERTFVVWTRVDNPNGVFAELDSPASDAMGYSGIPGHVNIYFWKRFGSAIMLSLIKDFSAAGSERWARASNTTNNNNTAYQNSQQAVQDMASEALRNSINIPPTLQVLPATVVNVMVARDVSFEQVYGIIE